MSEEREKQSAAAAAAEQVRAIVEAAERETEEQLRRLQGTAESLAARADEIEAQLEQLAQGVRESIRGLREDLRALRGPPGETAAPAAPEPTAPEPPTAQQIPAGIKPASEGARVIALNMALGGSSREETASYLAENFELDDPDTLLDEVYTRAAGGAS